MDELKKLMGRFITPTIVIDGEILLGFGMSFTRIQELVAKPKACDAARKEMQ
jgi:hypothetical protein